MCARHSPNYFVYNNILILRTALRVCIIIFPFTIKKIKA